MISYLGSTVVSGAAVPQVVSALFPLPVTLSGGIGGLTVVGTLPNGSIGDPDPVVIGGRDITTGEIQTVQVDPITGGLLTYSAGGSTAVAGTVAQAAAVGAQNPVVTGGVDGGGLARRFNVDTAGSTSVVGPSASGQPFTGAPVRIGGAFNTTPPTFGNGQVGDFQMGTRGSLNVTLYPPNSTFSFSNLTTSSADGVAASASTVILDVAAFGWLFNGLSFDKVAKPRTAFKLPTAAATNNATNIKTTAGTIFSITCFGAVAGPTWLKFFDTTGAPNPAALAQFYFFPVVAGLNSYNLPSGGLYFPTGIGVALVTGVADLNNTAVAAGDVLGLLVTFL